jgi:hypothetical protein
VAGSARANGLRRGAAFWHTGVVGWWRGWSERMHARMHAACMHACMHARGRGVVAHGQGCLRRFPRPRQPGVRGQDLLGRIYWAERNMGVGWRMLSGKLGLGGVEVARGGSGAKQGGRSLSNLSRVKLTPLLVPHKWREPHTCLSRAGWGPPGVCMQLDPARSFAPGTPVSLR